MAVGAGLAVAAAALGLAHGAGRPHRAPHQGGSAGHPPASPSPSADDVEAPLTGIAARAPTHGAAVATGAAYAVASGVAAAVAQRALTPPALTHMVAVGGAMLTSAAATVGAHAAARAAAGASTAPLLDGWVRGRDVGVGAGAAGVLHVAAVWAAGAVGGLCGHR